MPAKAKAAKGIGSKDVSGPLERRSLFHAILFHVVTFQLLGPNASAKQITGVWRKCPARLIYMQLMGAVELAC